MQHNEFAIGATFWCGGRPWRCTDIGTRVITAILLEHDDDPSWYNGPPYAVAESVFDEYDIGSCSLEPNPDAVSCTDGVSRLDRTVFVDSPEIFDAFHARLDEPPQPNEKLRCLLQRRPPWKDKT